MAQKPLLKAGAAIQTKMTNLTEKEFLETYGETTIAEFVNSW